MERIDRARAHRETPRLPKMLTLNRATARLEHRRRRQIPPAPLRAPPKLSHGLSLQAASHAGQAARHIRNRRKYVGPPMPGLLAKPSLVSNCLLEWGWDCKNALLVRRDLEGQSDSSFAPPRSRETYNSETYNSCSTAGPHSPKSATPRGMAGGNEVLARSFRLWLHRTIWRRFFTLRRMCRFFHIWRARARASYWQSLAKTLRFRRCGIWKRVLRVWSDWLRRKRILGRSGFLLEANARRALTFDALVRWRRVSLRAGDEELRHRLLNRLGRLRSVAAVSGPPQVLKRPTNTSPSNAALDPRDGFGLCERVFFAWRTWSLLTWKRRQLFARILRSYVTRTLSWAFLCWRRWHPIARPPPQPCKCAARFASVHSSVDAKLITHDLMAPVSKLRALLRWTCAQVFRRHGHRGTIVCRKVVLRVISQVERLIIMHGTSVLLWSAKDVLDACRACTGAAEEARKSAKIASHASAAGAGFCCGWQAHLQRRIADAEAALKASLRTSSNHSVGRPREGREQHKRDVISNAGLIAPKVNSHWV